MELGVYLHYPWCRKRCPYCDFAVEVGRYVDETVDNLRRMGFCALNDGEEVAVKNSNDFSEQYDIISSGGAVIQIYTATCRPAWSAIPPAGNNS